MGTKRSIKFLNLFVVLLMLIGPVMKGATPVSAQDRAGGVVLESASSGTADGTATLSIPHTTGSGDDRLMLVGITANSYNSAQTISSVTFTPSGDSAISMSEVGSVENEAGRLSAIYSLLAPPISTAGTVTITFSGSVNNGMAAGVADFSGVNQSDPLDDFVSAIGTEANTITLDVPTDPDDVVFDNIFLGAATVPSLTVGSDQSEQWNANSDRVRGAASIETAVGATTEMSWTTSGGSSAYYWALGAVPINPAVETSSVEASAIPSDAAPTVGDTIDVTINIDMSGMLAPDDYLGSFTSSLTWNPAILSYQSNSGILGGYTGAINPGSGFINFNGAQTVGLTGSIDVFTVTFEVIGEGDSELDLSFSALAADTDENILGFLTINQGSVVAEPLTAEVVLDGAISSGTADGATTLEFSHTTGSGENRLMLVGVSSNSYNGARTISSVTFTPTGDSAIGLTEVGTIENEAGRLSAIYSLVAPPISTAGMVTITYDDSVAYGIIGGAANFSGVNQSDPLDDFVSAVGTEANEITLDVPTDPGDVVFDNVFIGAATIPTLSAGTDQSDQWSTSIDRAGGAASIETAVGATTTMSWTATGGASAYYWALGAVPINPAPIEPPTCYALTLSHIGNGSDPVPTPANSTGCSTGEFLAGENITLAATPDSGWEIDSWTGTDGSSLNTLTMPASAHAASVIYTEIPPTCYVLTLSHSGNGSDPVPTPANSTGCSAGQFVAGESITLAATPDSGWAIDSWTGTDGSSLNTLTMPASAHAASVIYTEIPPTCYALTLSHSGNGSDPVPTPANSTGCSAGYFVAGESITLAATPDSGWEIDSWTGTDGSSLNTLTMPASAHAASVIYTEIPPTCYVLTLSHSGNGSDPVPTPANSTGCTAGQFVAGESITLAATPDSGWEIDSWTGTDGSSLNTLTMPASAHAASVAYVEMVADSVVASAIPSDSTPDVGDSITVTINIDMTNMDDPDDLLGSFTSSLSWNPAILSYSSNSGLLAGYTGAINPGSGIIQFNGAQATGVGGSIDVMTITFNVVGAGDAGLTLGFTAMASDEGNSILGDLTINQGSVVAEGTAGIVVMTSSSHGTGDGSDTLSFAHTTGTGVNRLLLVGISWNSGDAAENIESVVFHYDSTDLAFEEVITEQVDASGTASGPRFTAIYSLLNPPSGQAGTIIITLDDAVSNGIVAGAASFSGVNPAVPLGTPMGAHATETSTPGPTLTFSSLSGNELVFDNVFLGGADDSYDLTVGADQTLLWNDFDTNARGAASIEQAASPVTMSWTQTNTDNWWAQVGVPINPALGGVTYYDLTVSVDPVSAGTTNPAVGIHTYEEDSVVDITASPASGYVFDEWSGDCSGSGACQVTMTSNMNVVANFNPITIPITFTGEELLGRPTDASISIKIVPDEAILLHYEYGTTSGVYTGQTTDQSASAGDPITTIIDGLAANTEYFYRMAYSTDGGSSWVTRDELSFYTQRAEGSEFTFDITTDSHVNILLGNSATWTNTLNDVAADDPDFLFDLGDTFDMRSVNEGDVADAEEAYTFQLPFFNIISGSTPIFLAPGNHEQQEAWHLNGTANSLSVMGANAEKKYFLNPVPDGSFYTGDESTYSFLTGDQLKQDYYAFEWGDALFVVISPYWYTTTKPYVSDLGGGEDAWTGSGDGWDWTLGKDQFDWLKATLEGSDAAYKFLFMHQILSDASLPGQEDYGHAGANHAHMLEWGGYNEDGTTWGWDTERPGWGSDPIHQILVDNSVSAVFHGHDHQYAYEMKDGIVYQTVPSAGFDGEGFDMYTTGDGYTIQAMDNPGHLRVTVDPEESCVEYIETGTSSSAYTYCFEPSETRHDLTVSVDPSAGGSTTPAVGVHSYVEDSVVPVTAEPAIGYEFDHWSGACEGSGPCEVIMDGDKSVTAHFVLMQYTLSIDVDPSGAGSTSPSVGDHLYDYGSEVSVIPLANTGYEFAYWSGDCSGTGACELTVDDDMSVVAHFTQTAFNLTIAVDPAEGGTTIPSAGVHPYLEDTQVAVIAEPAYGYVFDHWSGACTGSGICSVIMDSDKSVTAHFTEITYDLTIIIDPEGGGATAPSAGVHSYVIDSEVSVVPMPDSDYLFVEWSGDCTGSEACSLLMDGDKVVTAHFALKTFDLTIEVEPSESGSTDPAVGVHTYDIGSIVDITPTPDEGYEFAYWSGDCTGTGACQVTIEDDTYVMAHFVQTTYDLTIIADPAEGGITTPAVGVHPYLEGTPVVVIAEPASGFEFVSWSGDCSGTGVCSVTMDSDKVVTANFAAITYELTVNVDPAEGGTTIPAVGVHTYEIGSPVSVEASAAEHYLFMEWTGDCSGTGACNLTMDGAKEVTAVFELEEFDLTIGVDPAGTGTTVPAIGAHSYPYGSVVDIVPTPEVGYEFAYWTGDCEGSGACQVTVEDDTSVVAHFMTATHDLTITVDPAGGGTTSPSAGVVHPYIHGSEVNIIPTAAEGYYFQSWGGDCSGSGACSLIMDGDKNVIAYFTEAPKACYALTISHTGDGSDPTPDLAYSEGCEPGTYEPGETINLSGALPTDGWHIASWYGTEDDSSTGDTNVVIMPEGDTEVGVDYQTTVFLPMFLGPNN